MRSIRVGGARVAALCAAMIVAASGCGEDAYCPSEVVLVFASPSDGDDLDSSTIDIFVRSNLASGDTVTLTITAGDAVSQRDALADGDGDVVFDDVPVGTGAVTLHVTGTNDECGAVGEAQISLTTTGEAVCELAFREAPIERDFYAPIPVLNTTIDTSLDPNFQANIDVTTGLGLVAELFVNDIEAGVESTAGTQSADGDGLASFPISLAQGRQAIRAVCRFANGSIAGATASYQVFVDTEAPTCTLDNPVEGAAVFPDQDEDSDPDNGTQITLRGAVVGGSSGDVLGESVVFSVDAALLDGSAVDAAGLTSVQTTFSAPNLFDIGLSTQDHAGNGCAAGHPHQYVTDGCSIAFVSPVGVVTSDANALPGDGVQLDMTVQVGVECEGQTVTTDCGNGETMAVVPTGGATALRITMCTNPSGQCAVTENCTTRVTDPIGFTTAVAATIQVDTQPPPVGLAFFAPAVDAQGAPMACDGGLTPSQDVDTMVAGMQIDVVVVSPLAAQREVEVTSSAGTVLSPALTTGDARVTLEIGDNNVVAIARDQFGNEARTGMCTVRLANLVVGYRADIADGLVGRADGAVVGSDLTLDICGTVSATGATVGVSIDGGAAQAAGVIGTTWCLSGVTLSEGDHTIDATATAMAGVGFAPTLDLTVDLTGPTSITSLVASAPTRQSVLAAWIAGNNGGSPAASYRIKIAQVPLSDANFDTTGTLVSGPTPLPMGSPQSVTVNQLRAGSMYYIGVAAVDAAGNRSVAQTEGPVIPDFDFTDAIEAPEPADGDNGLGFSLARGRFNADAFWDVAIAAPYKGSGLGAVYVYFGSATGISATPNITIRGTAAGVQFGNAIAAVRWSNAPRHDLVISAPFADVVYVYNTATIAAATTPHTEANANLRIGVSSLSPANYFAFSGLGWNLTVADFDGDSTDDLIMSAVAGGGGNGGVAVMYGGTATGTPVLLHDGTATEMNGAVVHLINDPLPATFDFFGQWVFNLGKTGGVFDAEDDIGIAYLERNRVYFMRGRSSRPSIAGVYPLVPTFGIDLAVINNSTDTDGNINFGGAMGSLEDMNGDGARDVIIASPREGANAGRVVIVDGNELGTDPGTGGAGVRTIGDAATDPFTITRISAQGVTRVGSAIVNNANANIPSPDINADGVEDLILSARSGANDVALLVWYGGILPVGNVTTLTSQHAIRGNSVFNSLPPSSGGIGIQAIWAGDVNADGLRDICWADSVVNSLDGAFEVFWDDGL